MFAIDLAGFAETMKAKLYKWLYPGRPFVSYRLRPFDCSLCLTWWTGLLYLLIVGRMTIPMITTVAVMSWLTPTLKGMMMAAQKLLDTLIAKLIDFLDR